MDSNKQKNELFAEKIAYLSELLKWKGMEPRLFESGFVDERIMKVCDSIEGGIDLGRPPDSDGIAVKINVDTSGIDEALRKMEALNGVAEKVDSLMHRIKKSADRL